MLTDNSSRRFRRLDNAFLSDSRVFVKIFGHDYQATLKVSTCIVSRWL